MPHWLRGTHFAGQDWYFMEGLTCLSFGPGGRKLISLEVTNRRGTEGPLEMWVGRARRVSTENCSVPVSQRILDWLWKLIIAAWRITVAMDTYWFKLSYQLPVCKNCPSPTSSTWFSWPCPPGYTWLSWGQHLTELDQWISSWCFLTLSQREHLVTLFLKWLKMTDGKLGRCWPLYCPLHGKSRPPARRVHMQRENEGLHGSPVPDSSPPEARTHAPTLAFYEITSHLSSKSVFCLEGFWLSSTLGFEVWPWGWGQAVEMVSGKLGPWGLQQLSPHISPVLFTSGDVLEREIHFYLILALVHLGFYYLEP